MAEEDKKEGESVATRKKKNTKEKVYNNRIEINPKLEEAKGKTAVVGWGRMNPITSGHEKLVNKIKEVARKEGGFPVIFLTHSQDAKKNPLSYNDKVMLARKAFGNIIQKTNSKTIIQAMQELQKKFNKVILVVGADRISEFETLLNKYNGKDFTFDSIDVVSAGDRTDPDSDAAKEMTADTMSASVMRKLASQGDFETFQKGLPSKLKPIAQDVYDMVRGGMKIAEALELDEAVLDRQARRQRAITMRRYKSKIAAGRKKAMRKAATQDKLEARARKKAIKIVRKKVASQQGADYENLDVAQKMIIDKKVAKRKAVIDRIAKKMLPKVRQADRARRSGKAFSVNEEFDLFLEESAPTKRFHELRKKDGSVKLDGRFRAFKKKKIEEETPLQASEKRLKNQHKSERENLKREHENEVDNLKTRGLRMQIRKINTEEVEFESDFDILNMIEEISYEINESILLDEEKSEEGLKTKAEKSGMPLSVLKQVYDRGVAAWNEGERPGTTPQQWGYARVNSFVTKSKGTWGGTDKDLAAKVQKEEVEMKESLWANIHAKRKRIKAGSGERMRKPGSEGAPTAQNFKDAKEDVELDSFFDLNEAFELAEASMLDKALAAIHKHVTAGKDLNDMAFHVSRARDVEFSTQELRRKYIAKFGDPEEAKAKAKISPEVRARLKKKFGFNEEGGAGDRGTPKVTKRYKKDTPGEIDEAFESLFEDTGTVKHHLGIDKKGSSMKHMMKHATMHVDYDMDGDVDADDFKKSVPDEITGAEKKDLTKAAFAKYKREKQHTRKGVAFEEVQLDEAECQLIGLQQIKEFEKVVDKLFKKFNIDFNFTRHFGDRMSDERNTPCISLKELADFIKKIYMKQGKSIKGVAGAEAVIKDMQTDLNIPVAVTYDSKKDEFDVVMKTIMRKKNFMTSNPIIKY